MARGIAFQQAAMAANQVVTAVTEVVNSEFNPLQTNARVSLFAAATNAGTGGKGALATLKLGSDVHISDFVLPVASAVSTRDHLVGTGVAYKGSKITVGLRNDGTAINIVVNGYVVIEPIGG